MTVQPAAVGDCEVFFASIDVAPKTEVTYRTALAAFAQFLSGQRSGNLTRAILPIDQLREDSLAQFRRWMRHDRRYSRRTEGTYLAGAVRLLEWLDANSRLPIPLTSSRMKLLLKGSRGRRHAGYKTQPIKEAVPLILEYYDRLAVPQATTPRARRQRLSILRNRAIVHVLFATGVRAQELASLRRSDCADGEDDKIHVTGKGEKERVAALNLEAQAAVKAYLCARDDDRQSRSRDAPRATRAEPLFVRHDRDNATAITTKTVWQVVRQAAAALGLNASVSPHDFRRYMATTLLSEGMPLESVQAFLGHESIVTTRTVYAHTWSEVLNDQVQTYRPTPEQALRRARRRGSD